jgi:hypothetical protein
LFQQADVGERSAASVVIPISLVLILQSPLADTTRRHTAAVARDARAAVLKHTHLDLKDRD